MKRAIVRHFVSFAFFLRPPTFRRIGETAHFFLETRYEVTYVRYLHRVGRAGRFGTKGLAITFVSTEEDTEILNQVWQN